MQKNEDGLIRINIKIVLLLLILAIIVLALSIFPGAEPSQKNDNKISLNDSNTSTTQVPASNTTNKNRTSPVSIPLEKPPFID